jgi:hypothetical protein
MLVECWPEGRTASRARTLSGEPGRHVHALLGPAPKHCTCRRNPAANRCTAWGYKADATTRGDPKPQVCCEGATGLHGPVLAFGRDKTVDAVVGVDPVIHVELCFQLLTGGSRSRRSRPGVIEDRHDSDCELAGRL